MWNVLWALLAGSVGSVALAGLMLRLDDKRLQSGSAYLLYLAGGTLLGAALLGMIPKAIEMEEANNIMLTVLVGILFFFSLEKVILWRSCRDSECERKHQAAAPIIIIGDAFHNAIDGVVIAASFLTSQELGVFVTLSVILHEIPQELGDFGILIQSGYSRKKAFLANILSGSTALIFGIGAYFAMDIVKSSIPWALAISAASFLYIALADLIPEMHRKTSIKDSLIQITLILTGVLIIYTLILVK